MGAGWASASTAATTTVSEASFIVHNIGISLLLALGAMALFHTSMVFYHTYAKLNSVVKAFSAVLIADWVMALIFLPQAVFALFTERLVSGIGCRLLAWAGMAHLCAQLLAVIVVSYATLRLSRADPLSDRRIATSIAASWALSAIVATVFWPSLGPYRDLYCLFKTDDYQWWAAITTLIAVFGTALCAAYYYHQAWQRLREMEDAVSSPQYSSSNVRGSVVVLQHGALLVSLVFVWWSLIVVGGVFRVLGIHAPVSFDVAAALLVKCMPAFDAVFIWSMVIKVTSRDVAPEAIERYAHATKSSLRSTRSLSPRGAEGSLSPRGASAGGGGGGVILEEEQKGGDVEAAAAAAAGLGYQH